MKLSAGLNIGTHKFLFTGLRVPILFCFFSFTLFAQIVFAEVMTKAPETTVTEISAVVMPTPAPATSASTISVPTASVQTIAPTATNLSINKPALADPKKISSSSQLANLVGGLMLILGLIYGLSWFVKRFSQGGFMQNSTIKMLSTMPLGTRERIMLVDVGGKQILLGITATHINALHVFEEPVVNATENAIPASSEFSQKLMALLQKRDMVQKKDMVDKNDMSGTSFSGHKNLK